MTSKYEDAFERTKNHIETPYDEDEYMLLCADQKLIREAFRKAESMDRLIEALNHAGNIDRFYILAENETAKFIEDCQD